MSDTISTAEIRVVADASGVEAGLRQATDAAQRAERQMSGGSERSARSQQNLIQSIQRTTAQMEAGSRTSARYFEVIAQQRGVDPAALQPYLQQLRAIEQAQQGAGQSAGQTANALRQVPAQLTDIVTSLQGGMEPLTVLIQQGGQLRDSFGGIGPAARAMGGQLLALLNPFTVTAAAVAVLSAAYYSGSQEADAYRNSIIMTGNAIGTSVNQMADMAREISKVNGTQAAAAEALVALVDAGNVPADRLQEFATVAIDLQDALGKSVADTAQEFAKLGDKPVEAAEELNSKYHFLTSAVYDQIKALDEQGRKEEAAAVAQGAYSAAMAKRSKEVVENLGYIESRWKELGEFASNAWDKMLGIGRRNTPLEDLNNLLKDQERIQKNIAYYQESKDTWAERAEKGRLAGVQAAIAAQRGLVEADKAAAKAEGDRIALDEKKIEVGKALATVSDRLTGVNRQYLTDLRALQDARELGKISEKEYTTLVSKLASEEYKRSDAGKAAMEAAKAQAVERKKEKDLLAELSGVTTTYMEDLSRLNAQYSKGGVSQERYVELVTELISKQPAAKKAMDETAKEMADYAKATTAANEALEKEVDAITKQVQAARDHNEQIGLTVQQIAELEAARLESMANRLEEDAIIAEGLDLSGAKAEGLRQEAAAYRDLAEAKRAGGAKQAAADSAKQAAQDWKRAADSIEQSITDALMRGFESGKGFGKNLVDTIRNMFNTLVLRPIISAIVNPVAGTITNAMGLSGTAQAAAGAGGYGNIVSTIGSTYSMLSGGMTLGGGVGTGFVGSLAGGLQGAGVGSGLTSSLGLNIGNGVASVIGEGAASTLGSGLSAFAAAAPYLAAFAGAYMIYKSLDDSGTYHTGGASFSDSSGTRSIRAESIGFAQTRTSSDTEALTAKLTQGIVGLLDSTATTFGKTAGYTAATAFADDTSKDGAWGGLVIKNMDGTVLDWNQNRKSGWAPREFADGEEGQKQYLAELSKSVRTALDSIGLPTWAKTMLSTLGNDAGLEEIGQVVQQINATQTALKGMGQQMSIFANLSDGMASKLIAAAGGIDSLANSAAAYYDKFYTDAEKTSAVMRQVGTVLQSVGLSIPATKEEFRDLVEANMALGEAGAKTVAALLSVSGAFAEVKDIVGESTVDLSSYRSKLTEAYNAESQALQATISRMGSFAAGLRDLNKSALLGALSPLSPQQKYAEARSQYEAVVEAARSGDEGAQDRYQDVYTAFLEASRLVNASGAGYRQDFDYAQETTSKLAMWTDGQVSMDQAQLTVLKSQVTGIIEINTSVLSVRDALLEYNQALAQKTGAGTVPTNAPIPYYASEGRTNNAALEAEVYGLRTELAGLRADQQKQTGDTIVAQTDAAGRAAAAIEKALSNPWKLFGDKTRVAPQ